MPFRNCNSAGCSYAATAGTLARVGLMRAILESGIAIPPVSTGSGIEPNFDSREASPPDDSARLHSRLWNGRRQQAAALHETLDLPHFADAVKGLRAAGQMDELPRGMLTMSPYHFVRGEYDVAEKHLSDAQQIAERGPIPLFLADIHLTRARLAGSLKLEV